MRGIGSQFRLSRLFWRPCSSLPPSSPAGTPVEFVFLPSEPLSHRSRKLPFSAGPYILPACRFGRLWPRRFLLSRRPVGNTSTSSLLRPWVAEVCSSVNSWRLHLAAEVYPFSITEHAWPAFFWPWVRRRSTSPFSPGSRD